MGANQKNILPNILLVEDDYSHTVLIQRMFSRNGVMNEIIPFANGIDFLSFLENQEVLADKFVVLLDLNLPLIDGYQILERLRSCYPKTLLPVLVISTTVRGNEIELSYAKGCNTFLKKPLNFLDLMESINSMDVDLTIAETSENI